MLQTKQIQLFWIMLAFYTILSLPFYVAIVGTILLSLIIYLKSIVAPSELLPQLFYKESTLAAQVLRKCRLLNRSFSASIWIRNAHVQTWLPWILPKFQCQMTREYLQLRDRGVVALDWMSHLHLHKRKKRTIFLVIPGLTGNASSVARICDYAAKKGFQPLVFNRRGHGSSFLTTPKFQNYGDPCDLRQVVKYIRGKYPKALITLVSYGSGCDLLLSYLGEFGSSAYVCAGVCVSPCFDLSQRSAPTVSSIYDLLLLFYLKSIVWKHARALDKVIDIPKALFATSLREFDKSVFCKMFGFTDLEDFYERNNPLRDADDISVPLLFINSLDDPVYQRNNIPYDLFKCYPNFFMATLERGGHCGFIESIHSISWADRLVIDYLESILEFTIKGYTIDFNKSPARSTI